MGGIKEGFEIVRVMEAIGERVRSLPPAALFQLADEGFSSVFEQLMACIISIRTKDEVTLPSARQLFALARTPAALVQLSLAELDDAIRQSTFHEAKAPQMRAIAQRIRQEYAGVLPCDFAVLTSFQGVGPKCANLTLGIACQQPRISVDVHVHRITNRWGYVATRGPEATLAALEQVLPKAYWIEINRLLVPFGKHICTGTRPKCSICPVLTMCAQVGVTDHR
ncbi:MAG: endonuclease III [Caldilineaceae bacterium]|nr:endonuclease III [Caldilineaceae bacterium]